MAYISKTNDTILKHNRMSMPLPPGSSHGAVHR